MLEYKCQNLTNWEIIIPLSKNKQNRDAFSYPKIFKCLSVISNVGKQEVLASSA